MNNEKLLFNYQISIINKPGTQYPILHSSFFILHFLLSTHFSPFRYFLYKKKELVDKLKI
jgi:hypothetical protein